MSIPVEVDFKNWNTKSVKYGVPKVNKVGGKSINILNPGTNRFLQVVMPTMDTWGISDFVNKDTNESDGKFKISLIFPTGDYSNAETDLALQKMKDFEAQILEDAAKNSELWWGEPMSKDILKHMLFTSIKYPKDPKTKKVDLTKSPNLSAKVANYNDKWNVDIYDTKYNRLFPCDNPEVTPMDLVVKLSKVNCILECGGIWIGGKGWGITWRLVECVVKPREQYKSNGQCRIKLSDEDIAKFEAPAEEEVVLPPPKAVAKAVVAKAVVPETHAEDSDNEEPEPLQEEEPEPLQEEEPEPEPVKKVVKKVVKEEDESAAPKKVVKKVVAKK